MPTLKDGLEIEIEPKGPLKVNSMHTPAILGSFPSINLRTEAVI
jgi:hypothetical protein